VSGPRVALLVRAYAPTVGGAERQVGALAPLLREAGFDAHVVSRSVQGLPRHDEVDGVPVHRLPAPGPRAAASAGWTAGALALLRRLRPDVLHAHELFSPATTALAARRLLGIPVVGTAHRSGALGDVQLLRESRGGERRLRAVTRGVDRFVVISAEIADELAGAGVEPRRLVHIPNGVDVRRFHPAGPGERQELRARLGVPVDGPLVLFTGRLAEEKRVGHLLDVWPAVRTRHPGATLVALGEGPLGAELRGRQVDGAVLPGLVDDVEPWHRAADLFVLPSVAEGLSVAMLEALASGVPPLVTSVGGTGQVVTPGRNGWVVPPDDVPALERALVDLLADLDGLRRAGEAGRRTVEDGYTLQSALRRHADLYTELATRGR
jgi:glycosyltransferase involved in cell wall biosynthesis